jgi:hypothetical protein
MQDKYLYFADICGGPGGFTEYIYWRKKNKAKGWGITLKVFIFVIHITCHLDNLGMKL